MTSDAKQVPLDDRTFVLYNRSMIRDYKMIQSASLPNAFDSSEGRKRHLYGQYFTLVGRRMLVLIPAVHSNLNRTSFFPISKYGKITGKSVHSNHFLKAQTRSQPSPMGGFEPDLNGYLTLTIESALLGGVEVKSNCSRTTVNKAKIRPPQTLYTFKVEDAECSSRREDAECSSRREDVEFFSRREGAERSLRSINLHFLSPFPYIYLSNIVFPSPSPDYLIPDYPIPNLEYRPRCTNRIYLLLSSFISGEFPTHPNINAS